MEIRGPFNASHLLPTKNLSPSDPFWISSSSPAFQGCPSMVKFENSSGQNVDVKPYFSPVDNEENGTEEDEIDPLFHHDCKKRRLNPTQVKFLEKSFEMENKLAPERKVELATETGLQPRQVAIWFQNRRARSKNKQLEKNYAILNTSFDKLKAEYEALLKQRESLMKEVELLRKDLAEREKSEESDPFEIDKKKIVAVDFKTEDLNSAKSDVLESNVNNSNEVEHSDISQDEEESFMHFPCLPKIEDDGCYNYPFEMENNIWFQWP